MIYLISIILAFNVMECDVFGFISPRAFWFQHGHDDTRVLMDRQRIEEQAGYLYFDKSCLLYFVIIVPVKVRLDNVSPKKVLEEYPIADFDDANRFFPFLVEDTYGICF